MYLLSVLVQRNNNYFMLGNSLTWEIFLLSNKSTTCILYCTLEQRPQMNLSWKCATVTVLCVWCREGCRSYWCAQNKAGWWTQGQWSQASPRWVSSKDSQGKSMESDKEARVCFQRLKEISPGLPVPSICWSLSLILHFRESNCLIW